MISRGANLPLHVQFKHAILHLIRSRELRPDDVLPGERQLAEKYGVSRTTVRSALNELVAEGTLYRSHGRGTFVAARQEKQNLTWLQGFAEELQNRNEPCQVQIIKAAMERVPAGVAEKLQLPVGEHTAFIQRLVSLGDAPVFLDRTYIVPDIGELILGADLANEPIYTIVERLGYPIREGAQVITALNLPANDAALLAVPAGSAALSIQRVTYVDKSSPIEYAEALYRPDRYEYQAHLHRYKTSE